MFADWTNKNGRTSEEEYLSSISTDMILHKSIFMLLVDDFAEKSFIPSGSEADPFHRINWMEHNINYTFPSIERILNTRSLGLDEYFLKHSHKLPFQVL